jgi:hypothetical protein
MIVRLVYDLPDDRDAFVGNDGRFVAGALRASLGSGVCDGR